MNHVITQFHGWSAKDLWILGLCCVIGVCLLAWAVTEVWERSKPVTPSRPAQRALTNRELCALLNCEPLRSPAIESTRGSIRDFRKMHTRLASRP